MNVLVVSYYSLWSASVGSRRMNGLIAGLVDEGHQVAVVCAEPAAGGVATLPAAVTVLDTATTDRVVGTRRALGRLRHPTHPAATVPTAAPPSAAPPATPPPSDAASRRRRVNDVVRPWVAFPDTMWEWWRVARRRVRRSAFVPDLVIGSAPPMAALRAASAIAHEAGCPWIADMRDLWTGDPYRVVPALLRRVDQRLERSVLTTAAAFTTVADVLADELTAGYPTHPVTALRNGFDRTWLRRGDAPPASPPRLVYTGTLTANTGRDLGALADLVEYLADDDDAPPRVDLYGSADPALIAATRGRRAGQWITFHGPVPAGVAREAQHSATALLSFAWEDHRDFGKCPAKLFEYAAARRPIIHIGAVDTLGTQLIRHHHLGSVIDPRATAELAESVRRYAAGAWQPPSPDDLRPLSHDDMIDGFRRVIATTTATTAGSTTTGGSAAANGEHTDAVGEQRR